MPFYLIFCVLLSSFCSKVPLAAADFHAILIGDCYSKDIRQASKVDLEMMEKEVKAIARSGKFNLNMTVFHYEKPIASEILKAIKNLNPVKNDLVLFYFSGHGYRTSSSGTSPWPNLDFPIENCGIELKDIINILKEKNAALSIIIADCCNWKVPEQAAPPILKGQLSNMKFSKYKINNYRKLFCKTNGIIATVSAKAGQPSYCTSAGSFYTFSFLNALQQVLEREEAQVSWSAIFDYAYQEMGMRLQRHNLRQDPVVYRKILVEN